VGIGVSVNAGPLEIYFLTDNVLALGTLNLLENNKNQTMVVDGSKVKNGQVHFGVNLTFGRDKGEPKHKDDDEEERAEPVNEESKSKEKESSGNLQDNTQKTVTKYPTADKDSGNKPNKSNLDSAPANAKEKSKKESSKSNKSDLNAEPGKAKKDNKKKIDNTPRVPESEPRERTYRKVPKKI
jgi:hypothetical protein